MTLSVFPHLCADFIRQMETPLFVKTRSRLHESVVLVTDPVRTEVEFLLGSPPDTIRPERDWFSSTLGLKRTVPSGGLPKNWANIDVDFDSAARRLWEKHHFASSIDDQWERLTRWFDAALEQGLGCSVDNVNPGNLFGVLLYAAAGARIFFCWRAIQVLCPANVGKRFHSIEDLDPDTDSFCQTLLRAYECGAMPCGWDGPFPHGRVVAFRPDHADDLPWVKAWHESHPKP